MLVNLDPRDARPLYLQIMDEIRRALVVGALRPDDPLPSVRELSAQLVVNPRTVQQAYRELEREGVIYVKRGMGTYAAPHAPSNRAAFRKLARDVARRALLDARRNRVGLEELLRTLREVADEEERAAADGTGPDDGDEA